MQLVLFDILTHFPLADCLAVILSVSLRPVSRSWRPVMDPVCAAVWGFQKEISPFRVATANSWPSGRYVTHRPDEKRPQKHSQVTSPKENQQFTSACGLRRKSKNNLEEKKKKLLTTSSLPLFYVVTICRIAWCYFPLITAWYHFFSLNFGWSQNYLAWKLHLFFSHSSFWIAKDSI